MKNITFPILLFISTSTAWAQVQNPPEPQKIIVNENKAKDGTVVQDERPVPELVAPDTSIAYVVVEQYPEYPGGEPKWTEYLTRNLKYPADAVNAKLEGSVYVSVTVLKNGNLTDIKILKGLSPSCDEEAKRVIRDSGAWTPGRQKGVAVKTRIMLPIKFQLNK